MTTLNLSSKPINLKLIAAGGATTAGGGANQMMELLSIKAAKDLGIDMAVKGAASTAQ